MSSINAYPVDSINFDKVNVSDLNKDYNQPLAFINYYNTPLTIATGPIKITSHGIPRLDGQDSKIGYFPDDNHREFIKLALDPNQPACVALRNHLEMADQYYGLEIVRKKLFGKLAGKYEYQASVRKPYYDNDDDDNSLKSKVGKRPVKMDYCKIKFNVIPCKDGQRINKTIININGQAILAQTITDIAQYVKFGSTIRCKIQHVKVWANKSAAPGYNKIMYGLGLKMLEINIGTAYVDWPIPIHDKTNPILAYKEYMFKLAYNEYMAEKNKSINKIVVV